MARIELIEHRLREWAHWLTTGNDGSGYSALNVLHPEWSPPTPGTTPTLKTAAPSRARETHAAVEQLSQRLANTLVVYYCKRKSIDAMADELGCQENTLHARIDNAHRQLALILGNR
jgi:DNA-directed RNA polymerase specialized sigma24 family protein